MKKRREIAKNPPKLKENQKPEINQKHVVNPAEANSNLTKNDEHNPINEMGSETASKSENTMTKKAKKIGIAMIDPRKSPGLKMIKKMKNKPQNNLSCKKCGSESTEDQKFCKKCGKKLRNDPEPTFTVKISTIKNKIDNHLLYNMYRGARIGHERNKRGAAGVLAAKELYPEMKPQMKRKVETHKQKKCTIEIGEEKLTFSNKKGSWPIMYSEINSMRIVHQGKFAIKTTTKEEFTFQSKSNSKIDVKTCFSYVETIFNDMKSKYEKVKAETKAEVISGEVVAEINPEFENDTADESESSDPIESIKKLNELKESGILTIEEFENKKKELLERI